MVNRRAGGISSKETETGNLLLEGADGTIREVDIRGKAPEYPRIKALVKRD